MLARPDVFAELGRKSQLGMSGLLGSLKTILSASSLKKTSMRPSLKSAAAAPRASEGTRGDPFHRGVLRDVGAHLIGVVLHVLRRLLVIVLGHLEGQVQGPSDADVEQLSML